MPMRFDPPSPQAADGGRAGGVGPAQIARTLLELPRGLPATVVAVEDLQAGDAIAERLRELGFVAGEPVRVVATGPMGGEPLLVQIGFTRFALRKAEAARVQVAGESGR